jgi:putative methyltransferase (TIGR04325 family)
VPRHLRRVLKQVTPPFVTAIARRNQRGSIEFSGDYKSWQEAAEHSTGYDSREILEKVRQGALKVKRGEAAFERDSVAFEAPEYRWPLLASLLDSYIRSRGHRLHVLDFGGSLGSVYFQHRRFLDSVPDLHWSVVEQPHYVRCGRSEFQDEHLSFFESIQEALTRGPVDVALFSGVLQYLENPYEKLEEIGAARIPIVLIDRTAFTSLARDRLAVQNVPASIYSASYPHWLFSERKFQAFVENLEYGLVAEFADDERLATDALYKGLYYRT